MKRRLTIARALINNPEVLFLDQPTTGLDPQARHITIDSPAALVRHESSRSWWKFTARACVHGSIVAGGRLPANLEDVFVKLTGSELCD